MNQLTHKELLIYVKALANPRIISVLLLGFASGLPLALTTSTLSAWYTEAGVSVVGIGFLTLVGQPYVYKFIWAPLMDRFIPPFLGRRRGWIIILQFLLIIAIAAMALLDPKNSPSILAVLALIVAFLSASQDISINAYMTDIPKDNEKGMSAAMYVVGYRIALIVATSFALILAQHVGFQVTYLVMSSLMLIGIITTWCAPNEPQIITEAKASFKTTVIEPFKEFFERKGSGVAILILIIMVLYKLGDAYTLSLSSPFLLRFLHFSLTDLAIVNKGVGFAASIIGGILGGVLMARMSLFRALVIFGLLQAVTNLGYMLLAYVGHNFTLMSVAISIEYFCSGLGTTAFLALIMQMCNKKSSATQFALLSALATIGRVYVGPSAGFLVESLGWVWFYLFCFFIGLPGVLLLFSIRKHID